MCKNYVGGVAISYIERVELGTDYEIDNLLASKIKKSTQMAWNKRFLWYVWMAFAYYCLLLPFTAEIAFIPIIGGILNKCEMQSAAIGTFSLLLSLLTNNVVAGFLWLKFQPIWSFLRALAFAAIMVVIFKCGESMPADYAKYKLGYF